MNNKLTLDTVKNRFNEKGLKLLSRKYHNNKEKLRFKCLNCGYRNRVSVNNLKRFTCKCVQFRIIRRQQMLEAVKERETEKNIDIASVDYANRDDFCIRLILALFIIMSITASTIYALEVFVKNNVFIPVVPV